MKHPIVLTIIDGLGLSKQKNGNAFLNANTPTFDKLFAKYPNSVIGAAGEYVGLPKGQMGNSEVGHLNIGAGEVVYTGLALIQKSIDDGTYSKNAAFQKAFLHVKKNNSTLHLMGLLSDGGVHSHQEHLFKLIEAANIEGVKDVVVHAFLDGRDVPPKSSKEYVEKLVTILNKFGYKLGSISGRLYAMDRDSIFSRTNKAYMAIAGKEGNTFKGPIAYIESEYLAGHTDEFVIPAYSSDPNVKFLNDNDSIIFFNFRPDRARQLSHLLIGSKLWDAKPPIKFNNLLLVQMMNYEEIDSPVAFKEYFVKNPLGKVLSEKGFRQLRIAETQKYAHVTFFFDGGIDIKYEGSKRIMVPSEKVENFAKAPFMSAKEITTELIAQLHKYDVVIMNYANPDMVGHTGNYDAAIKAVEFLDTQIARLLQSVEQIGGTMFITADHGNAEIMKTPSGDPVTSHSTSDVMLIITDPNLKLKNGVLSDIAPTILNYMGVEKPKSMTGKSLIKK